MKKKRKNKNKLNYKSKRKQIVRRSTCVRVHELLEWGGLSVARHPPVVDALLALHGALVRREAPCDGVPVRGQRGHQIAELLLLGRGQCQRLGPGPLPLQRWEGLEGLWDTV